MDFDLDSLLNPNEIRICDICKMTNINTLKPRLEKLDPNAIISVGCQSFCGPGSKKSFAIVNDRAITADNEDELVKKIEEYISK